MNIKPRLRVIQCFQRKIDASFQQFQWLRQKIVIGRIPQHTDPVRFRQRPVVELDLHVEHVGHTGLRQFFHVLCIPDPTAQRNSFRDPGHVHAAFRSPSPPDPQSSSYDYSDSTSPFPSPSLPWMVGTLRTPQFLEERLCHRLLLLDITRCRRRKHSLHFPRETALPKVFPFLFTNRTTRLVISTDESTIA